MLAALRQRLGLPDPAPPAAAPRTRFGLYPFELCTAVVLLAAAVYIRGQGLRLDGQTIAYTLGPMVRQLPVALGLGVGLQLLYHLLPRQSVRAYLGQVLRWRWLVLWLRVYLVCLLWNYVYFWLKVYVPLLNPRTWDATLWHLDTALHLGISPSVFLFEAVQGTWALPWLDRWYGFWITSIFAAVCFFSAHPRDDVRRSFTLACVALWTAGATLYVALPALGPIYVFTDVWQAARGQMPSAEAGQRVLWANYQKLLAIRESGVWSSFNPTRGVAAMPSLHVGGHFLLALWSRRVARPLAAVFLGATLLTFVASIATGWHYAVDGYVAILLAWLATRLALRLEPVASWLEPGAIRLEPGATSVIEAARRPESPAP